MKTTEMPDLEQMHRNPRGWIYAQRLRGRGLRLTYGRTPEGKLVREKDVIFVGVITQGSSHVIEWECGHRHPSKKEARQCALDRIKKIREAQ